MSNRKDRTRGIIPYRFKAGESGNPGGSAKGYRRKLSGAFLRALAEDFDAHGAATIIKAREQDPLGYSRLVANLLPKEIEIARPFEDVSDEELAAMIDLLRTKIATATAVAEREDTLSREH